MRAWHNGDWSLQVAYLTPSVITCAPVGQATVRLLITHGPIAQSIDLPAKAAEWLVKALPECIEGTQTAFKASYGEDATSV